MKSMFKISMVCGLLLSLFGTVEAARKDSPGVAERKAITGNFDVAEADQLLADIPEDWKKEHRSIVNKIKRGEWGRGVRAKKIELEMIEEGPTEEPRRLEKGSEDKGVYQGQAPATDKDREKSAENSIRLVDNMRERLSEFTAKLYLTAGRDPWSVPNGQFNVIAFQIDKGRYNDAYHSLINYFNTMLDAIKDFEMGDSKKIDNMRLAAIEKFLEELKTFGAQNDGVKGESLAIVDRLSLWNKKRLVGMLKLDTKAFTQTLNEYIEKFGGQVVAEGKMSTVEALDTIFNILSNLIEGYYDKKHWGVGYFGYDYYALKSKFRYSPETTSISDLSNKDDANFFDTFNKFIKAIHVFEGEKDKSNEKFAEVAKHCQSFVDALMKADNLSNEAKEVCSKIMALLKDWYTFRITNVLKYKTDELKDIIGEAAKKFSVKI